MLVLNVHSYLELEMGHSFVMYILCTFEQNHLQLLFQRACFMAPDYNIHLCFYPFDYTYIETTILNGAVLP
jgi:hypothetical protein